MQVSPLAPAQFPDLPQIDGVTFASVAAGVKYQNRADVMLALLAPGTAVAGVFTRSATRSAPVLDCQAKLGGDASGPAAILVNSGNSNAFTGGVGVASVRAVTQAVASETGVPEARVFTASTGVIGEPLPHDRIVAKIAELKAGQVADGIAGAATAGAKHGYLGHCHVDDGVPERFIKCTLRVRLRFQQGGNNFFRALALLNPLHRTNSNLLHCLWCHCHVVKAYHCKLHLYFKSLLNFLSL